MSDEPISAAPELDVQSAPEVTAPEATPTQPQTTAPAPVAQPVPDWLLGEPTPPMQEPMPGQYQPPMAQPTNVPTFVPPQIDYERFVQDPSGTFWNAHLQATKPLIETTLQLANKVRQLEAEQVNNKQDYLYGQAVAAKNSLKTGYQEFQRDPSFANPAVRQTLDTEVKTFYSKALRRIQSPDPETVNDGLADLAYMRTPQFRQEALRIAKAQAGYPQGQTPTPVQYQGGRIEGVTPSETGPGPDVPPEMVRELRKLGPGYEARYKANLKKMRDLGWEE